MSKKKKGLSGSIRSEDFSLLTDNQNDHTQSRPEAYTLQVCMSESHRVSEVRKANQTIPLVAFKLLVDNMKPEGGSKTTQKDRLEFWQ